MSVKIHGKEYITVAERVQQLHESLKDDLSGQPISIKSEVIQHQPVVVVRAVVTIGENEFSGISGANPSKAIEKASPYEVAETSAIGRALGFAGFGIVEGIASADEIAKSPYNSNLSDTEGIINLDEDPV